MLSIISSSVDAAVLMQNYIKGPTFHATLEDLLGDGIFNVDGDKWETQRKTASHMFSANMVQLLALFRLAWLTCPRADA